MQKLLKISQQTTWQAVFKVVTTTGGFIIIGLVSRNYGEAGVGNFTLALTYLAFFYVLADFGFNGYILGKLQQENFSLEWRKLLGVRIIWALILTVMAAILPLLFAGHLIDFRLAVLVGIATIFLNSLFFSAQALIQAKLKYEYATWPVFLSAPAGVLLIFYLTNIKAPIYFLTLGYVLSWLIYSGLVFLLLKKIVKNLTPIFSADYAKKLFRESSPLAATLILNVVYFRIDSFLLSYYQNISSVGLYNLAYQIFQAVLVLPTYIMNSFYPMMLAALRVNLETFLRQVKLAIIGLFAVSVLVSLVLSALSPYLIKLIAVEGFEGSVASLQILSCSLPAFFLSALLMWIMIARGYRKSLVSVYLIGLIFNLLSNFIFIPQYSYFAASWVTVLSEYLILIMQIMILWPNRKQGNLV